MSNEKVSVNQNGGARAGAGRKKGLPNKLTAEAQEMTRSTGVTPLEYLLEIMRNPDREPRERLTAAISAAPYVHSKLSNVESTVVHKGDLFAALLAAVNGTSLPVVSDD